MTEAWMEIRHNEVASRPLLGGRMGLREALRDYARHRWPTNTAKSVAREWDLSLDEAKGLVAGRPSINTLDSILWHKRGGFTVGLQLLAIVVGHSVQNFFAREKERLDHEAEQTRLAAERSAELERLAARSLAAEASHAWAALAGRHRAEGHRGSTVHRGP